MSFWTILILIAVVAAAVFMATMFKGWKDGKDNPKDIIRYRYPKK